jgi:phenylalanyl-tRNA synthetase beta chain
MDRVVRLIVSLAGGTVQGILDVAGESRPRPEINLRAKRIAQVLGDVVPLDRSARYLSGAGFEILKTASDQLTVRVPSWRGDVSAEVDLIEEVARFHGYDKFPDDIRPFRPTNTFDDPQWTIARTIREQLVGLGLYEIWPIPFVRGSDDTHVRLANPLAESEGHLRHSLLETLARRAEYNLAQRTGDVRLFEIGSVSLPDGASVREELRVGALIMGRRRPPHFTEPQPPVFDEWDAKGIAEVAARAARPLEDVRLEPADGTHLWRIVAGGKVIGAVSRLVLDAPVWAAPAFGVELTVGEVQTTPAAPRGQHSYIEGGSPAVRRANRYRTIPVTPPAEFDLALLVPNDVTAERVEAVIRDSAGDLLEKLDLFDQYAGSGVEAGTRSLAWRLTFRHPERTLRDKEIEGRRNKILGALDQQLHVRQRSV